MKFANPLITGKFIKRYKRFMVDAELPDGEVVVAHCANTGSMLGLLKEGFPVYLSPATNPERKLRYSLEMIDVGTSIVGVNTSIPNQLVAEALANSEIPSLTGYTNLRREVKYGQEGKSRIDVLLESQDKPNCYVEVKNVTLREGDSAQFPDAVTERGQKHLDELMAEVGNGNRAVMFYVVQRTDCKYFTPAVGIDKIYTAKLQEAAEKGVEILCYACDLSENGIELASPLEIRLKD